MSTDGLECWAAFSKRQFNRDYGPCEGNVVFSEDYADGGGSCYCERHGHCEDDTQAHMKAWDEKPKPKTYVMHAEPGHYNKVLG